MNTSIKGKPIKSDNFCSKPFFLKIDQDIILNTGTEFNRNLLKSKLKDIFSNKISKKIKKYEVWHNKNLIAKIYEETFKQKQFLYLKKLYLNA